MCIVTALTFSARLDAKGGIVEVVDLARMACSRYSYHVTQSKVTPTRLKHVRRMTPTDVRNVIEGPPTKSTRDVELADLIQMREVARLRQSYRYALGCVRDCVCVAHLTLS